MYIIIKYASFRTEQGEAEYFQYSHSNFQRIEKLMDVSDTVGNFAKILLFA